MQYLETSEPHDLWFNFLWDFPSDQATVWSSIFMTGLWYPTVIIGYYKSGLVTRMWLTNTGDNQQPAPRWWPQRTIAWWPFRGIWHHFCHKSCPNVRHPALQLTAADCWLVWWMMRMMMMRMRMMNDGEWLIINNSRTNIIVIVLFLIKASHSCPQVIKEIINSGFAWHCSGGCMICAQYGDIQKCWRTVRIVNGRIRSCLTSLQSVRSTLLLVAISSPKKW